MINIKLQMVEANNKEPKRSKIFICCSYEMWFAFNLSRRKLSLLQENCVGLYRNRRRKKNCRNPKKKAEREKKEKETGSYLLSESHLSRDDGNDVHF